MSTGISVITCTNKPRFLKNIFLNFTRQKWKKKELIIIINSDKKNLAKWKDDIKRYKNVSVFWLPARISLGQCLNFAVRKAKYEWIAKCDDDDYYGPYYLSESVHFIKRTNADIVGKRSYYIFWTGSKQLRIRFPGQENRPSRLVHGGTIIARKKILQAVPFADCSLGEDHRFLRACRLKGYRIYSMSRFNYCYRRRNHRLHTWKADPRYLWKTSEKVAKTSHILKFVNRKHPG